jgi:hypothetical protein
VVVAGGAVVLVVVGGGAVVEVVVAGGAVVLVVVGGGAVVEVVVAGGAVVLVVVGGGAVVEVVVAGGAVVLVVDGGVVDDVVVASVVVLVDVVLVLVSVLEVVDVLVVDVSVVVVLDVVVGIVVVDVLVVEVVDVVVVTVVVDVLVVVVTIVVLVDVDVVTVVVLVVVVTVVVLVDVVVVEASVVEVVLQIGASHASAQLTTAPQVLTGGNGSSHLSVNTGLQLTTPFLLVFLQSTHPGRPQRELMSARLISLRQAPGSVSRPSSRAKSFSTGFQHCRKRPALAAPSHGHLASMLARTEATAAGSGHLETVSHLNFARAFGATASVAAAKSAIRRESRPRFRGAADTRAPIARGPHVSPGRDDPAYLRGTVRRQRACGTPRAAAGRRRS